MPQRTLYRSREERMLAGVCGGIGEYFAVDPTLVRLVFVLLGVFTGVGVLAYIVLWIVVPEEGGRPLYEEWKSEGETEAAEAGGTPAAETTTEAATTEAAVTSAPPATPEPPAASQPPAASGAGPVPVTGATRPGPNDHATHDGRRGGGVGLGIILIVVGGVLLANRLIPQLNIDVWKLWPLLIIAIGMAMILRPRRR